MKKYFLTLAVAALTLGFSACEDVPAPYEINSDGGNTESDVFIDESFATSLGDFSAINTVGSYSWACSYSCAQVTSFVDTDGDGVKENMEAESWLISPKMDMTNTDSAYVSFDYILRYANANELKSNYQLLVSGDYNGLPAEATWTALEYNQVIGVDWDTWTNSGRVAIPEEFLHKPGVTVALLYKTGKKAATWEVKNFQIKKGNGTYTPGGGTVEEGVKQLPYSEAFSTTLGAFKNYTTSGEGEWMIDFSTAKATGYDNASKVTTAGTYYLVSPEIDLTGKTGVHVTYEYILRYDRDQTNQQVYITDSFDETKPAEGWTLLNGTHTEGVDWTNFSKADLEVPAAFLGKKVRVAFRYNTNSESGSTWEVKNFSIAEGKQSGGDEGGGEIGDPSASNGDFENWTDGKPNNWSTASTAGKATLKQSTDAHSGKYAVEVVGKPKSNQRIGYKETTLLAGTYTMKFYVKAATATGGSVRPGYVVVVDGKVSGTYQYGDYTNNLTPTEWTLVEHTFTLDASTQLCLVIMNSGDPGANVIIDDFTLTNEKGEALIK